MLVTTTRLVRYSVLPGVWPRIKELFGSGFGVMAGILAVVYYNIGLLPIGHPYLVPANYGRFGLRHVIAAAGRNVTYSWKHSDQIFLYFTTLLGLVLLAVQFVLVCMSLFFYAPAFAFPLDLWGADLAFDFGDIFGAFTGTLNNFFSDFFGSIPTTLDDFYSLFFGFNGAASGNWTIFTETAAGPSQDIAFVVLDQIFGIMQDSGAATGGSGFYESCVSTSEVCRDINGRVIGTLGGADTFPGPMHLALHQMLGFYTLGIGYLAGVILIYYVITIVGETVVTGTPFGQRFNKAWAIPRMIAFFALLAPITFTGNNQGINVAQLITFSVAKFGSNFASNIWVVFVQGGVQEAGNEFEEFFGKGQSMLARPNLPELGTLVTYMHIVKLCMYAEKIMYDRDVLPYVVRPTNESTDEITLVGINPQPQTMNNMGGTEADSIPYYDAQTQKVVPFRDAVEFSRYQDVVLRFGYYNPPDENPDADPPNPPGVYDDEWGYVRPVCGELQFEVTSLDPYVIGSDIPLLQGGIQAVYWEHINEFLRRDKIIDDTMYCVLNSTLPYDHNPKCVDIPLGSDAGAGTDVYPPGVKDYVRLTDGTVGVANFLIDDFADIGQTTQAFSNSTLSTANAVMMQMNKNLIAGENIEWGGTDFNINFGSSVLGRLADSISGDDFANTLQMPVYIQERGWAGAPLWYNKLANLNGTVASAIQNLPRPFKYPLIMEEIAKQHNEQDSNSMHIERFNPRLSNGQLADLPRQGDQLIAAAFYHVYKSANSSAVQESVFTRKSNNAIIDTANMILGTQGVFDIVHNRDVYPLALLSALGKSMVDAALRNLWVGVVGQGLGEILDGFPAGLASVGSEFAFKFGMIALGIGFILYYVLPILPFVYFFFAFSGWIKSIFEAVLAMPLWALAHLKIDGHGLPGPWASNGYFLLFEIFLRPTLIVAGYVFSISLYAALVNALHDIYHIVVFNASGFDTEAAINAAALPESPLVEFDIDSLLAHMRGPIDEIFYSVIYVIIVYMIGLSCFKLVDTIPNNIMRWMGVTVSSFQERSGDAAGQMTGSLFRSTQTANIQITDLISRVKGFGSSGDSATQMAHINSM
ncbi:MAG: DotA/TraY family protein [Alphaproteobacteria bacterium]